MTQPKPPQPIADDIPVDRAWKVGRRIYVRCGYQSTLNGQLREVGATWDPDTRALWVGSGKLDKVLLLVKAQVERVAQVEAVKATGRWVTIPYDAADIRMRAKALGGVWDGERKQWALPTDEAYTQVITLVTEWARARDDQRRAEREREQAARRAADAAAAATAKETDAARKQGVIARSGRIVVDEQRSTANGRLYGRLRRPQAEAAKPQPGQVRKLKDGRRALVLSSTVTFWSQDAIDDGVGMDLSAEPGWYYTYEFVVVEPTADEAEQDRVEAAERADENAIDTLVEDVRRAADSSEVTPDAPRIRDGRTITCRSGSTQFPDGTVTLTDDGEVWWYHPGYYDDYRAVQGRVTDEALVDRVREVLAAGSRRRGRYEVRA